MIQKVNTAGQSLQGDYAFFEKQLTQSSPFAIRPGCWNISPADDYNAFWFHPDHLGSSSYISNNSGEISQHLEYFPFGETLVEEHKNSNNSPYKFNAKELDAETGNYYYGARYYNPKFSIWLSVDPMVEKYPGWSPYNYTLQNPIRFIDPDGRSVDMPDDWIYNRKTGKYDWDGSVTKLNETPSGFDYVGSSLTDVNQDYKKRYPVASLFSSTKFTGPEIGEFRTPYSGEIQEHQSTVFEKAKGYGVEHNIPLTESAYNILDDVSVFLTSFDLLNPVSDQPMHLDGTVAERGSQETINSGINGLMTIMPIPKFNLRGFNMAQSNKLFKGTLYNKLSPKIKGKALKSFNYLRKNKIYTPKRILKTTNSIIKPSEN